MESPKTFGELLAHFRRKKGWTQQDLANHLGVSNSETISRYERGEREPRLSTLLIIGQVLGVSPRALIPIEADAIDDEEWLQQMFQLLTGEAHFTIQEATAMVSVMRCLGAEVTKLTTSSYYLERF